MSEHVFQNGSQPARGLLREPQQRHVEIHREPVAQHGLDKRAENLDVDHPGKNLPEGGVGPSHEGGPLVLRVLEQPAVLVRVALGLLGVVLVLAHGEALLSAARLELIQLLLEQRHAVEMKVVILRKLLPALRHDHRSQGLVAAQKLPLFDYTQTRPACSVTPPATDPTSKPHARPFASPQPSPPYISGRPRRRSSSAPCRRRPRP
mmetsp:Transcript_5623/g.13582  ORF Transcript_5623/g.13582 Transcript_5623/m.13582 type:complete len:206 (-) Transcript_5623:558-1175(-)